MKTAVALAVAIVANSLGNLCLSKGMKQYGNGEPLSGAWLIETGYHVVSNGWLILGVLLLLVFLAAYLTALSWADLSFVLPATAPAYLLTSAMSKFFLHETVSPVRWVGTLLIVTGTSLVARTYTPPKGAGEGAASGLAVTPSTAPSSAGVSAGGGS
jgi:uncharacterized membrane protein